MTISQNFAVSTTRPLFLYTQQYLLSSAYCLKVPPYYCQPYASDIRFKFHSTLHIKVVSMKVVVYGNYQHVFTVSQYLISSIRVLLRKLCSAFCTSLIFVFTDARRGDPIRCLCVCTFGTGEILIYFKKGCIFLVAPEMTNMFFFQGLLSVTSYMYNFIAKLLALLCGVPVWFPFLLEEVSTYVDTILTSMRQTDISG